MTNQEIYRIEQLPVFQNRMFSTQKDALNCAKGDIILVQDSETGLIYNQTFQSDLIQYDTNYQNEQALSPFFKNHLEQVCSIIQTHSKNSPLIEVGCGKGYFLEFLQKKGLKIKGFDPIYEGNNPNIEKKYFTSETSNISADIIILRHVLEHVVKPLDFLDTLRKANCNRGKIYIEVPCLDWISARHAWFDIFYEHVNYFRLTDFTRMFSHIHEAGHIFDGQYLYIVADLASLKRPKHNDFEPFTLPANFLGSINLFSQKIKQLKETQRFSAIWGGASKGVIFSLLMARSGENIDLVIDINPAKQGLYLPATGLQVQPPQFVSEQLAPGSEIFLMNKNYLNEVQQLTANQFNFTTVDHDII